MDNHNTASFKYSQTVNIRPVNSIVPDLVKGIVNYIPK